MKKYIIIILSFILLSGSSLALAQEYTVHEGPSDLQEELENQGNYQENEEGDYEIKYIETREELDSNLFENIGEDEIIETKYKIPGYLNYKSWQFWFLIFILLLILYILIRLFKKLSKINKEIKRHENYLQEVKTEKRKQVSEKDEIIYTEPHDE